MIIFQELGLGLPETIPSYLTVFHSIFNFSLRTELQRQRTYSLLPFSTDEMNADHFKLLSQDENRIYVFLMNTLFMRIQLL